VKLLSTCKGSPWATAKHFVRFICMELVDKIRRLYLRQARLIEERALIMVDEREQGDLLDITVPLKILAELRRVKERS
jgi:hypothetical protein